MVEKSETKADLSVPQPTKGSKPVRHDLHKKWTGAKYGPIEAIVVTVITFFGSQILLALLVTLYSTLIGKGSDTVFDWLGGTTVGQFTSIFIVEAVTLALVYAFIRSRNVTLGDIGLGRLPKLGDLGFGLVYFVLYFTSLLVILALATQVIPGLDVDQEQQLGFESARDDGLLPLVFISLVILPPIAEEIMVRGFLYTGLRAKLRRIHAALIASLVFGIAHLQLGMGAPPLYVAAIDTFVLSMFLIHLREQTGSLWSGMLVHALKNGLAFVLLFVVGTS